MAKMDRDEELTEFIRKEEKEFREQKESMETLIACPGWHTLVEIVERHRRNSENQVVYNTEKEIEESGSTRERLCGECAGLMLFTRFPDLIINTGNEDADTETDPEATE